MRCALAGSGPTDLQDLADELLNASIDALNTIPLFDPTLEGAPDRAFVCLGAPALDCCPQLTVHIPQILQAPTEPGGLAAGRREAGSINHIYLVVTSVRCAPGPDARGNPPSVADLTASAEQLDADAWALWNHLQNLWRAGDLFTLCGGVFWDALRPLGPSGQCAGWTFSIHVTLDGYEEAIAS